MLKANINNGRIDTSTEGSAGDMLAELSTIIAVLHSQFSARVGVVKSLRWLDAAMKTGIDIAHQNMMEEQ
nr:MAG TPA: hypothetical protein [Bacteriophage sp.]